jgi:uncharacterized membrane protein
MDLRLIYSILLTIMPVTELRAGMPLAMIYFIENNLPVILAFFLIVSINILVIFAIFYFLDVLHNLFMNVEIYKKYFNKFINRFQKKVDKFEKRHNSLGFLALVLFVAIPLPGTGVWTGCLLSWVLGLDRKKSIISIIIGTIIAGAIVFSITLGAVNLFS